MGHWARPSLHSTATLSNSFSVVASGNAYFLGHLALRQPHVRFEQLADKLGLQPPLFFWRGERFDTPHRDARRLGERDVEPERLTDDIGGRTRLRSGHGCQTACDLLVHISRHASTRHSSLL